MYYERDFLEALPAPKPVTPTLEPWQQQCLDAAAYIREHGWCQGDLENAAGNVCIYGALDKVSKDADVYRSAVTYLINTLEKELHYRIGLDDFNDLPSCTQADVLKLLESVTQA